MEVKTFLPALVRTLPGFVRSHRQHQHLQQRFNGLVTAHRRPVGRVARLKEMALGPIIILDRGGPRAARHGDTADDETAFWAPAFFSSTLYIKHEEAKHINNTCSP